MVMRYLAALLPFQGFTFKRYGSDGEVQSRFNTPSMRDSAYHRRLAKSNPERAEDLLYGWDYGNLREVYTQSFFGDTNDIGKAPTEELGVINALRQGNVVSATLQAGATGVNLATAPYRAMGSIGRQIMFMSAFELSLDKYLKRGISRQEARQLAAEEALADTREVMFARPERDMPPALKGPLARLATQFTMFYYRYLAFLLRPGYRMIMGSPTQTRAAAAKQFFGTLLLLSLTVGATGLPGYGQMIMLLEMLRDDEDDDEKKADNDPTNPVNKIDLDAWFRTVFIPETFGTEGSFTKVLDMSPEAAELASRSFEYGALSAVTGVNFYSSLSLGKFWANEELKGNTDSAKLKELFYNFVTGPAGAMVDNFVQGFNLIMQGDTKRGMEAILPKIARGPVKMERFAEEGVLSKDRKQVMKDTYFTPTKKTLIALGFNDLEISIIQEQNYVLSRQAKRIEKRKSALTRKYNFAADEVTRTGNSPEAQAGLQEVMNEMNEFDKNFPEFMFDFGELTTSEWKRIEERAGTQQGLSPDLKLPAARRIAKERAEKAIKEKEAQ
jgi:hypothetical protein